MKECYPVSTPMDYGAKLSKNNEGKVIDSTLYRSLIGCLRYLTCTRPHILYSVGLVSRFIEEPKSTHWKIAKRILHYIQDTLSLSLFYFYSNNF